MNVMLDAIFIGVIKNGVGGAAIATLISQCFTAVISCICLLRKNRNLHRQNFTAGMLIRILKVGFPVGIESMLMTISNVVIQYYINGFGENAVAAFSVYYKAENILYLPVMAFGPVRIMVPEKWNASAGEHGSVQVFPLASKHFCPWDVWRMEKKFWVFSVRIRK